MCDSLKKPLTERILENISKQVLSLLNKLKAFFRRTNRSYLIKRLKNLQQNNTNNVLP